MSRPKGRNVVKAAARNEESSTTEDERSDAISWMMTWLSGISDFVYQGLVERQERSGRAEKRAGGQTSSIS